MSEPRRAPPGLIGYEAWRKFRIKRGDADHAFVMAEPGSLASLDVCAYCDKGRERHHPDMVGFDNLSPDQRAVYEFYERIGEMAVAMGVNPRGRNRRGP